MATSETGTASSPDDFRDTRSVEWKLAAPQKAWTPTREPDQPNPLSGLVIGLSTQPSDYDQGDVPRIQLLAKDGTEWSVVGFHTLLRRELQAAGPRLYDRLGILYQGEGVAKEGQSAPHRYRVVLERNPDGPQEPDPDLEGRNMPLPGGGQEDDIPFAPTSIDSWQ
jgi:hypothetical protein